MRINIRLYSCYPCNIIFHFHKKSTASALQTKSCFRVGLILLLLVQLTLETPKKARKRPRKQQQRNQQVSQVVQSGLHRPRRVQNDQPRSAGRGRRAPTPDPYPRKWSAARDFLKSNWPAVQRASTTTRRIIFTRTGSTMTPTMMITTEQVGDRTQPLLAGYKYKYFRF